MSNINSQNSYFNGNSTNANIKIIIGNNDFNINDEYQDLLKHSPDNATGAVVTFVGLVRADKAQEGIIIKSITLEHYPQMTEKILTNICHKACQKYNLMATTIIHRIGKLLIGEQIVYVGVVSPHRSEAFAGCEMIIDFLKTEAPFWKSEENEIGRSWVLAKNSDEQKILKWQK